MSDEPILVVAEEPSTVRLCAETLALHGYQVQGVGSGREALDRMKSDRFDLLLLDLPTTECDGAGLRLLSQARALDPDISTVAMVAGGMLPAAIKALRAGAWGFVLKPYEADDLLLAVREALEERRQNLVLLHARCPIPEIFQASMMGTDLQSRVAELLAVVVRQVKADRALMLLLGEETDELTVAGSVGVPAEAVEGLRISREEAVVGQALERDEPWVVENRESLCGSLRTLMAGPDMASTWFVPLHTTERAVGVLIFGHLTGSSPLAPSKRKLLSIMSDQMATAVQNAQMFERIQHLKTFNENIVQSMEEGILIEDEIGRVTFVNPKTAELLGYTPDELAGKHWADMVAPEYLTMVEAETAARPLGMSCRYEAMVVTKGGHKIPVLVSARPMFTDGNFSGVLSVFTDISAQKEMEAALRESQELWRTTFATLRDAVFVFDGDLTPDGLEGWSPGETGPDRAAWLLPRPPSALQTTAQEVERRSRSVGLQDRRIVDCNPAASRLFGYRREEMVDRTTDFLHVNEAACAEFELQAQRAIEENGFLSLPEFKMKRKDGTIFCTEQSVLPLVDGLGRRFGWMGVVRDITQRKRAQEELNRRNEELTALNAIATTMSQSLDMEQMLDATLDKVLELIDIDAGWIQLLDDGAGADTLRMATYRGLSQELAEETSRVKLGESMTGKVAQSGQPIVVGKVSDDPRLTMNVAKQEGLHAFAGVPIKSQDRVFGVLGVVSRRPRELSSQAVQTLTAIGLQMGVAIENLELAKNASEIELLRKLDRLRSELIANVSHELRTPLGLIKLACTTLLREDVAADGETLQEFLGDIRDETDKLQKIVGNLLDLSQMEGGQLTLDLRPVEVGSLVSEVVETTRAQFPGWRLVQEAPAAPLVVAADPERLEQVLRNLLSNAVKYSPESGTISVRTQGTRQEVVVCVSDQGIGIPKEDLERVFERFFRVENEITKRARGAGLGLAVCRNIIEAHGGRMWIESMLGEGTKVYFSLPAGPGGNDNVSTLRSD